MRSRAAVAVWVMLAAIGVTVPASAVEVACPWQWVNPMPPRVDLHRAAYGGGRFVAVGAAGTILSSLDPNGGEWRLAASPTAADLLGIDVASQHWVAVGDGVILYSRGGEDWSVVFEEAGVLLRDVEFAASRFVAVGSGLGGDVLVSSDGTTWSRAATELPDDVDAVTWAGNGLWACSGGEIYRSPDGLSWTPVGVVTSPRKGAALELERFDLAWTGSRLVWTGGAEAWISEDGETWELAVTVDGCATFSAFLAVYAGPSSVVLSGVGACPSPLLTPEAQIYVSLDRGESWALQWRETAAGFPALASSTAAYVALGAGGDLLTSGDGVGWSEPGSGCSSVACQDLFADVCQTDRGLVAAGGVGLCDEAKRLGGGTVARSGAGQTWTVAPVSVDRIRGLVWGDPGLVGVGDAWAATSGDGLTWQLQDVPTVWPLKSVAWADGHYVAVGEKGTIVSSTDGEVWEEQWSNTTVDLERIAWGGDRWLAVGSEGTVLWSTDMHHWHRGLASATDHLRGVAAGEGVSVAVGDGGTILVSTDASYWFAPLVGVVGDLRGVIWSGEKFTAVGAERVGDRELALVIASPDGLHWTSFTVEAPPLRSVTGDGAGGFVAVGEDRALLHAGCLGSLALLDPQRLVARLGSTAELTARLEAPPEEDVDLTLTVSDSRVASVPARVTLPRGSATVAVPVEPVAVGSVWVTATLPPGLGGGSTSAVVEVRPVTVAPRHPAHRLRP